MPRNKQTNKDKNMTSLAEKLKRLSQVHKRFCQMMMFQVSAAVVTVFATDLILSQLSHFKV